MPFDVNIIGSGAVHGKMMPDEIILKKYGV